MGSYEEGILCLEIPAIAPSPNRYNGHHWSHIRKIRKAWQWWVKAAVLEARCGALQWPRSRVVITRVSQRLLDPDNAVASCKAVLDALRIAGVILDDSAEHIELEVKQVKSRAVHTAIRIERLPNPIDQR